MTLKEFEQQLNVINFMKDLLQDCCFRLYLFFLGVPSNWVYLLYTPEVVAQ